MRLPLLALLLASWPGIGSVAAKDDPKIVSTTFDQPPQQLIFFDDSETALGLMLDASSSQVYRTDDAGGKWDEVKDIPKSQAYLIHPHPVDKNVSVILGRSKTHWITYDKGKTWTSFKSEGHPSRGGAIRYHATDSKKIIFNDMELCDIFTYVCLGKVYIRQPCKFSGTPLTVRFPSHTTPTTASRLP
jgi:photosystem II stability/assembly factor-like uncharacterized protein